jgi:protein ImuB
MYAAIHTPGQASPRLLDLASSFAPWVEMPSADAAVFSIAGLGALFGGPEKIAARIVQSAERYGLRAQVATASNPDAALLAARHRPGVTVIPPGEEPRVLGQLPLECLPAARDLYETLARWGLRTLGDLIHLPETGVHERLGDAGVYLQKLARGIAMRPLAPQVAGTRYERAAELDYPLELLEPLLFLLARFLNELLEELARQSLAAGALRVQLRLEGAPEAVRALRLPFPTRDAKFLRKLLEHELAARPPEAPVLAAALAIDPVSPRDVQHGLFVPAAPPPEKLELTLAKIRALVGEGNAGTPQLIDTHRPLAHRMAPPDLRPGLASPAAGPAPRLAFRVFRPPKKARVELREGVPWGVSAPGIRAQVLQAAGPWRSSGDWWRPDPWDRDEWDLALSDGGVYRACFTRPEAEWLVEGMYD